MKCPKLSAEVIARLTSSSIEEVGRSKGSVPKRSKPPPSSLATSPRSLPKDKESEQSDGPGDVERAVCATPLISQEEAAQTGQTSVQSFCQREEREALHEIFDDYIIRHLCKPDDDEFRFNDASTHEGHLRQNGELTWFCSETIIMISHKCIKCKTRTNLKIKAVILC